MTDWLEWSLGAEEEAEALELEGDIPLGRVRPTVRASGPDRSPGGEDERAGEAPALELRTGEALALELRAGETLRGGDYPTVRAGGPGSAPAEEAERAGGALALELRAGEALPGRSRPPVRARGPGSSHEGGAERTGEDRARGRESLLESGRRARAAVEYAAGRREPVAVPVPVPAENGGKALGAGELDRIFQRDARRYDGGFTLY